MGIFVCGRLTIVLISYISYCLEVRKNLFYSKKINLEKRLYAKVLNNIIHSRKTSQKLVKKVMHMTPSFEHTQLAQTLKPVYKTLVYIFDWSYSFVYINRHTKRDLICICTINHICGANIFLYSMCKVIKTAKTFPYDILLPNSLLTIHFYYLSY